MVRPGTSQRSRTELLRSVLESTVARRDVLVAARPEWPWAQLLPTGRALGAVHGEWLRLRDAAVLANLAALAAAPTPADYEVLASLVADLGGSVVAKIQHQRSAELEPDESYPIGTAFTFALTPAAYRPLFGVAGKSDDEELHLGTGAPATVGELEELCARLSMRFLVQGMDDLPVLPPITTVEEFLHCFRSESLPAWRCQLLHYAVEPWSAYARRLMELAEAAGEQDYIDGMRRFLEALREETSLGERQAIAAEIRRLVDETGMTQRDFARRIGTSASRLSSYLMGSATPSAAMFLRIRRAASSLRAEAEAEVLARRRAAAPDRPA